MLKLLRTIINFAGLVLFLMFPLEGNFVFSGGDKGRWGIPDEPGDTILTWTISGTTFYQTSNIVQVEITSGTFVFNANGKELNIPNADITIPPQSLGQNVYVFVSTDPLKQPYLVNPQDISRANSLLSSGYSVIPGCILEIALQDEHHTWIKSLNLNKPVEIRIKYPDENNDGYVDGLKKKVKNSSLKIYYLNENTKTWEEITTTISSEGKYAAGQITHFSVYALIGRNIPENLNEIVVYPVPYRPGSGGPYDNPEGIIFDHVPDYLEIKIFNIASELVFRDVCNSTGGRYVWKAVNNDGEKVASGVYLFILYDSSGNKKLGKLAIIK